ncbi:Arc family DNA-binding protein [Actinomadura rayongensis]|uniref:Arc family DNA-binding protein n=1 Tax=Actinomadura rayongensis TaxID=1429076 RepID=A0A6I4W6X1_9ACTN|nr:Arc family DNA-binding protein [Actinomadura rayongensis]MXQ62884.1 Arc family DNA-binding protein [Actinomadura rayongensis]
MATLSVRLPDELSERLTAYSRSKHSSANSTIIHALDRFLTEEAQADVVATAADEVFARRAELFDRLADT